MKALLPLSLTLVFFLFWSTAYQMAFETFAMPDRPVDKALRHFLMRNTGFVANRLIVDSGSNALHAINPKQLGDAFQRYGFTFADNADYPLAEKLGVYKRYLKKGDVLVLPLEWNHYVTQGKLPENFIDHLFKDFGYLSFYYWAKLPHERQAFLLKSIPPKKAVEHILAHSSQLSAQSGYREDSDALIKSLESDIAGDLRGQPIAEDLPLATKAELTCDDDVLGPVKKSAWKLSDPFRDTFEDVMVFAKHRGITVFITWPAVVSNNASICYGDQDSREHLDTFVAEIRATADSLGAKVAGEPRTFAYGKDCFLNTRYHIRYSCSERHTAALARDLATAGLDAGNGYSPAEVKSRLAADFSSQKANLAREKGEDAEGKN